MATVKLDTETMSAMAHKLIVAISDLAFGFDVIATELEECRVPRSEIARQVRKLADYTAAMAKEISL